MSIVGLLVILCVLGIVAYFIQTRGWIASPFKEICVAVLVVIAFLVVFQAFGLMGILRAPVPNVG